MKQILTTLFCFVSVMLSCEKPADGIVINPPTKPTTPTTPTTPETPETPENPEQPQDPGTPVVAPDALARWTPISRPSKSAGNPA